jgi:cleavage and polyadenylation specificity factor subunit 1
LVFSTTLLATLQTVITDSQESVALSLPQDPPRKPQDLDIDQILLVPIGESSPRPHLLVSFCRPPLRGSSCTEGLFQVFLRSGQLAIYEIHPAAIPAETPSIRSSSLATKFVKVVSQAFDIQKSDESEKSIIAEQRRISRMLIPFVTTPTPGTTYSGVFLTGERPSWILATNKSSIRIYPSGHSVVHSFTTCSLWESKGDFLLYADDVCRSRLFYVQVFYTFAGA